jgi:acyl dehydratase
MPNPVVQGQLSFGLLCRMLRDEFGPAFFTGGAVDVRFIRPVYAGQTVTARGEVTAEQPDRVECRVRVENPDGAPVVVGAATVKR